MKYPPLRDLGRCADALLKRFDRIGVQVAPTSRIATALRLVALVHTRDDWGLPRPKDGRWDETFLTAVHDAHEIIRITEALPRLSPTVTARELFRTMSSDPALIQDQGRHSPGRDAQFHLSLAAAAWRAGLRPHLAEPDIVVQVGGVEVGIAVKRVKSQAGLMRAIKGGSRQIIGSRRVGAIFLDVTSISTAIPGFAYSTAARTGLEEHNDWWLKNRESLRARFERLVDHRYVYGISFLAHWFAVPTQDIQDVHGCGFWNSLELGPSVPYRLDLLRRLEHALTRAGYGMHGWVDPNYARPMWYGPEITLPMPPLFSRPRSEQT